MVGCLLDVCGLWLCLPLISVFGVVDADWPYGKYSLLVGRSSGHSSRRNPWEGVRWMRCIHEGKWVCVSRHACEHKCIWEWFMWWYFVCLNVYAEGQAHGNDHPPLRSGAAWRTTQVSFSSDQLLLSGCPMWFHLDRQGLQLHSADSLSGHRAGVVQGKAPLNWLNNPHHAHTSSLASGASWPLWCLTDPSECVSVHWSLLGFFAFLGW